MQAVRVTSQIPKEILEDVELNEEIKHLPANYNVALQQAAPNDSRAPLSQFEIHKTVWRLRSTKSRMVALQFPEGLLMYACTIADILQRCAVLAHCRNS